MTKILRSIRLWWLHRRLHQECIVNQVDLWCGFDAPHGACTRCWPKMAKIRELTLRWRAEEQHAALPAARVL